MRYSADISPCGVYRYSLTRWWGEGLIWNFIMLNPSTADATRDDPTIRRCIFRAQAGGAGALIVTNLFALRATHPLSLRTARDPVGPVNNDHIVFEARLSDTLICAWGNQGKLYGRS